MTDTLVESPATGLVPTPGAALATAATESSPASPTVAAQLSVDSG
jgi:hypothetical protein